MAILIPIFYTLVGSRVLDLIEAWLCMNHASPRHAAGGEEMNERITEPMLRMSTDDLPLVERGANELALAIGMPRMRL